MVRGTIVVCSVRVCSPPNFIFGWMEVTMGDSEACIQFETRRDLKKFLRIAAEHNRGVSDENVSKTNPKCLFSLPRRFNALDPEAFGEFDWLTFAPGALCPSCYGEMNMGDLSVCSECKEARKGSKKDRS